MKARTLIAAVGILAMTLSAAPVAAQHQRRERAPAYVAQSDPMAAIWRAFDVEPDGTLGQSRVLFDATPWVKQGEKGLPDGMKVDQDGNLFATGPGGVHVFTPDGTHLGTFATGEATANCAFGDDGSTLYITAGKNLYTTRVETPGQVAFPT